MNAVFPQDVDFGKTTNRGLPHWASIGICRAMSRDVPQYAEIGGRLRALREGFSDLNQSEWADKHGFGITQYNNWEKGVRRIPVDEAERLCGLYGLTLDFVYRGRRDGLAESASKVV